MRNNSAEPTRVLETCIDDNGRPSWKSFTSPKSVKVRGECQLPPHLPGIIIFVHGVNSTGEWYELAEKNICAGLNERLGLNDTSFKLKENMYSCDGNSPDKGFRRLVQEGRSPVIRFYWGYRSAEGEEGKYKIPLVNIRNEDYHQLIAEGMPEEEVRKKGPFFWGGGPFQNGTTQLVSLWSKEGFKSKVLGVVPVQEFAPDLDRLLTDAPPREYYAHTAKRLADLVDLIRQEYPHDTVSIISHSQGTMIAMAATALAKKAPDALFILNSPYAMEAKITDSLALPANEVSSDNARSQTLSAIVDKIAAQAGRLKPEDYNALCVGKTDDKKRWTPDVTLPSSGSEERVPERDNHGRFYIYCNPHDRVMGASPLLSLGWQGLKNNPDGTRHPLLEQHKGHLYQRILARWLPCGDTPNPRTSFTPTDGKSFWDDDGDWLTYNNPGYWTLDINGEKVPKSIKVADLTKLGFDQARGGKKEMPGEKYGYGWGQLDKDAHEKNNLDIPNDDTYQNYINLYPFEQVLTGYEQSGYTRIPRYRRETPEERNNRLGKYISQPTDHSTLPTNGMFMSRVVAYDIPVGFCDASRNKAFMAKLRAVADWTQGYDNYMEKGILNVPPKPDIINDESISDVNEKNNRSMGRPVANNHW